MSCLTAEQIRSWKPYPLVDDGATPLTRARRRMEDAAQWEPWQMMGRRFPIGCVALEITQRCNLDCTYCYLSESSEALKDIPLEEVFRRIDLIHAHYGDSTDVQVTGGDPTLRKRHELVAIVRYIKRKNMRSSLFTNGIKATRDLLEELCEAGLEDVAFHVDMTQERSGYRSEIELNEIRQEYIERARGLPLSVFFSTTVYPGNFHDIPELVKFFVSNCDVVRLAAFQTGADSGRGVDRERAAVTPDTVQSAVEQGAGVPLRFDVAASGHRDCNRYGFSLVIAGRVYDGFANAALLQKVLHESGVIGFARANRPLLFAQMVGFLAMRPRLLVGVIAEVGRFLSKAWRDLLIARGRIGKLSFHLHNFQDAQRLDAERCAACTFMVMTPDGPLSMCIHNAKRDDYLLVPTQVEKEGVIKFWNPVSGQLQDQKPGPISVLLTRKNARGLAKADLAARRPRTLPV
ncbi:MAG: radical SAM protein [Burkholderiales bacterium]